MTQAVRRSPRVAARLSGWALCLLATFSATAAHAAEPAAPSPRREVAPGDFAPISVPMPFGTAGPASLSPYAATGSIPQPDIAPPGTCTFTALPNDNSTSGNERCPMLRNRFGRSVYLITASELAANGLVSGSSAVDESTSVSILRSPTIRLLSVKVLALISGISIQARALPARPCFGSIAATRTW